MELTKAIELLQMDIDDPGSVAIEDVNEAEKLGKQALTRLLTMRSYNIAQALLPLKGETLDPIPGLSPDEKKRLHESPLGNV